MSRIMKFHPGVIETSEVSDRSHIFSSTQRCLEKIIILSVIIETNLNLILIHLIMVYTVL